MPRKQWEFQLYNPTYCQDGVLTYRRSGQEHRAIKTYQLEDKTLVGIFQGSYGDRPDIDFILKFLEAGDRKRLRTPANLHWVVDLLLKAEANRNAVAALVDYYLEFYDEAKPFDSPEERESYSPITPAVVCKRFPDLEHHGTYSLEYVCYVIELFTICEKATPRERKMFHQLLVTLQKYFSGEKDFYQVLSATSPGFR